VKHPFFNVAAVTALAAGMAFGQNAPSQESPGHGSAHARGSRQFGADLNLTDAQKQQMRAIFSAQRQASQALDTQTRQAREALTAAVKSGASDAEIDKLSNNLAPLLAQSTASHAKAAAKFYSIPTPEQKDKAGDRFMMMMRGGPRSQGGQTNRQRTDQ
jgi:Spy/CpxP family protein refolding chaperone